MPRLFLALLPLLALSTHVAAQPRAPDRLEAWQRQKCADYGAAWTEALRRFGTEGLGASFLRSHDAFLATGCLAAREVCPRSEAELRLANVLSVAAMNAGAASTFLPFRCREG